MTEHQPPATSRENRFSKLIQLGRFFGERLGKFQSMIGSLIDNRFRFGQDLAAPIYHPQAVVHERQVPASIADNVTENVLTTSSLMVEEKDTDNQFSENLKGETPAQRENLPHYRGEINLFSLFVEDLRETDRKILGNEAIKALIETIRNEQSSTDEKKAAKEKIFLSLLGLFPFVARYIPGRRGYAPQEAIGEAWETIDSCIKNYDLAQAGLEVPFSSYFVNSTLKKLIAPRSVVNEDYPFRLPDYSINLVKKIRSTWEKLTQDLSRIPSDGELYSSLDPQYRRNVSFETFRVISNLALNPQFICFYRNIDDHVDPDTLDSEFSLPDIMDSDIDDPGLQVVRKNEIEYVRSIIEQVLTPREMQIVQMRYGNEATLEETGQKLGLSRERIRQLQNIILEKITSSEIGERRLESV